jgi:hypothetical protein
MISVREGQRVVSTETGMVGTIVRKWNLDQHEWWVEVEWDKSTMEADEVEPFEEDMP